MNRPSAEAEARARRSSRTAARPTATSSGDRSAGTPKIVICETVVELQDPAEQADGDEAGDGGGAPGHGVAVVEARRSACGLGQHLHEVEVAQVGGRLDVDRRSSSPSPSIRCTVPIRIPGGNGDGSRVETCPR